MKQFSKQQAPCDSDCLVVPVFERLNYYYGQALGVADFKAEQQYFLDKLQLHHRCFHGYGIVCGLEVDPAELPDDCDSDLRKRRAEIMAGLAKVNAQIEKLQAALEEGEDVKKNEAKLKKSVAEKERLERALEEQSDCDPYADIPPAQVIVNCGWALDCDGHEIIVRQPQLVDLRSLLSQDELRQIEEGYGKNQDQETLVELRICYCEQQTYPTRPVLTDACAPVSKCVYGRTREGFRFSVSLTPTDPDKRCKGCCEPCENECVVLAHIHWNPKLPIQEEHIDWGPRRAVSLYQAATITGVSWIHGATYTAEQAKTVLGTDDENNGIEVRFSRPVYAETLQPGVVDLYRIQGGSGVSGVITHIAGDYLDKPDSGLIDSFRYRDQSGETLNDGDRVLVTIRGNFILDECCQPVDGEHVGGLVPQLEEYQSDEMNSDCQPPAPPCVQSRNMPWTSGNGRPGATFESWFFVNKGMEEQS